MRYSIYRRPPTSPFPTWIKTRPPRDVLIIPVRTIIIKWTCAERKTRRSFTIRATIKYIDERIPVVRERCRASLYRSSHALPARSSLPPPLRPFPAGMTTECRITVFHFYVGVRRTELIPGRLSESNGWVAVEGSGYQRQDRTYNDDVRNSNPGQSFSCELNHDRLILRHDSCLD